jgi:hypothetical protein
MRVRVLFHDHCFDGVASAATFSRFYRERIDPQATFSYQGMNHKAGSSYDPSPFTDAEVHACVDFRYSASPKLTWWFDHHQSAFEKPEDEAHFRATKSPQQFHDEKAKSCTKYIARVTAEKFGFDPKPIQELIDWAEIIDSAAFPDPETAVALKAPAMQLMLTIEASQEPTLLPNLIEDFNRRSLAEIVELPYVKKEFEPLYQRHLSTVDVVRQRAKYEDGVVTYDVADLGLDNVNKFISYYLYPEATYTVAVSAGTKRAKVSVGSNAWRPQQRRHNIAEICESYGGGGHPVVGAISFPPDQIARAREVAAEVVAKLKS